MFRKFVSYITFWRKQEDNSSTYLRMMHGINRISIFVFLAALCLLIYRLLTN